MSHHTRHTRYEHRRKCAKCNITSAEDRNLSFHRFPLPGRHTILKARVWAEYCYPTGEWSTEKSLSDLHSQHKMLCSKHFDDTSFTSSARIRLNNYAVPIGTQGLLIKFRQEICAAASGREQDTNTSVIKPQAGKSKLKHCVVNKEDGKSANSINDDVEDTFENTVEDKVEDTVEDIVEDAVEDNVAHISDDEDVTSKPQLFSWQKDCEDLNYDSDDTTLCHQDSKEKQAEHNSIKESCSRTENTTNSDEAEDIHEGYKCDMCKGPIYRFRYTCVQCVNYDLCGACEGRAAHAQHYLLRVPRHRPYAEIKQIMDTIRHILSADIKSFQTEANYANEVLDEMKSEVASEAGTDPCPEEPDFPISTNDSIHEEDEEDEVMSCSDPLPSRYIVATHVPKMQTDEKVYGTKPTATPQTHAEQAVDVQHTDVDWLDEGILEKNEMSESCNTKSVESVSDSKYQHKKSINENSQLQPPRKLIKIDNRPSLSNASGKVSKRKVYGVVNLPKTANSTAVVEMLKTIKHSLETKVSINMERMSEAEIKLARKS